MQDSPELSKSLKLTMNHINKGSFLIEKAAQVSHRKPITQCYIFDDIVSMLKLNVSSKNIVILQSLMGTVGLFFLKGNHF